MALIDKLAAMRDESDDRDLLEYFGIEPGDPFGVTAAGVRVGGETVPLDEARAAVFGPPARTVKIEDL